MSVPIIRSNDPELRAQQWARFASATAEFSALHELSWGLNSYVKGAEAYLIILWGCKGRPDVSELRALGKSIREARKRLTEVNHALISLSSELEALHTALDANED